MRRHVIAVSVVGAVLAAVTSCRSDSVTQPGRGLAEVSAGHANMSGPTLVVDNDLADCPSADFMSIQAAVTAAEPGTTILVCAGVYKERVLITKSDLRLLAKGKPEEVVLDGQGLAEPDRLAGFDLQNAHDNLIEGFVVRNYQEAGIWLRLGSSGNRIRKNVTTRNGHDGIQLLGSSDNVIEHNVVRDQLGANGCGVNVATGSQRNVVRHNLLVNNEWGIQIADAAALDNEIVHNEALLNRGNGIRNVLGASGTIIDDNRVFDNGLTPGALTGGTAAGIRVASGTGIVVRRNHAFDNLFVDLRNEAAVATYENNHCRTSSPPALCEHSEGQSVK